jgi:homoserine dehydrogenase
MRADLALIGFGNVGRRFARLLVEKSARLAAEYDLSCRIAGIATAGHGVAWEADGIDAEGAIARVERGEPVSADRTPSAQATSFDIIERLGR